jgi:alanyl-tRNA synthetase
MKTNELRQKFLSFFQKKGHTVVPSDSLVPTLDPTLLFTGAGMNQFKDMLLCKGRLEFTRATSCQKCLRTGDIDNVGKTSSHHTFFEMLGNFSFGDYFKKEAIQWAWEFLLQELKLPPERLYASIYKDDAEALEVWNKTVGLPSSKILRFGEKENFWPSNAPSLGPNGPCGPCSEIFYDQGEKVGCGREDCQPNCPHCERFVEVWNLVFVQFNRVGEMKLEPLEHKSIDTGMGLERIARVMQGVRTNFENDLFKPIIQNVEEILGRRYVPQQEESRLFRRIADHLRAVVFCISDGVLPSNEGRGYVERRLLRRAVRDAMSLSGLEEAALYKLVPTITEVMQTPYPEVNLRRDNISRVIKNEEEKFLSTYHQGIQRLEEVVAGLKKGGKDTLSGEEAFRLYDTYGFPLDSTVDYCESMGLKVDTHGYEKYMKDRMSLSRSASGLVQAVFDVGPIAQLKETTRATEFLGYQGDAGEGHVLGIIKDDTLVSKATRGEEVQVILDRTAFYGEAGGQVGDTGSLSGDGIELEVVDTRRAEDIFIHHVKVIQGELTPGVKLLCQVNLERRKAISRSHTATHLLHYTLRKVLGDHAEQAGSLVAPDRLRFDFHHFQALTKEELVRVEEMVNGCIRGDDTVVVEEMPIEEAKKKGAMALFGEKYGERVRLVGIGAYSKELCGGIHLHRSGEVGLFKLVSEGSAAAGIRRIEALTGPAALQKVRETETVLQKLSTTLKVPEGAILQRVETLLGEMKKLEKGTLGDQLRDFVAEGLIKEAKEVSGVRVITQKLEALRPEDLRKVIDYMKPLPSIAVTLGTKEEGRAVLIVYVSKDLVKKGLNASEIAREGARVIGGSGGGRADMAQAGGKDVAKLEEALAYSFKLIKEKVAGQVASRT